MPKKIKKNRNAKRGELIQVTILECVCMLKPGFSPVFLFETPNAFVNNRVKNSHVKGAKEEQRALPSPFGVNFHPQC